MLLIARRTALAAALLLVMPLTVWLSGWLWQPGLPVAMLKSLWWVTETVTQPWGNYHFMSCLRLVPLVSALSAARGVDPVPYPCRRYPGGTGGEILGQGAGAGAETVRHLAGKHKAGAGDAILRVKA